MKQSALLPDQLAQAESRLLRTQRELEQIESSLYAALPQPRYWNRRVFAYLQTLELRYARVQSQYIRLRSAVEPSAIHAAAGKPPVPTAEPPAPLSLGQLHHQTAQVTSVDGIAVTKVIDYPNTYWLQQPPFPEGSTFCRQIRFLGGCIPEPYAEILSRHSIAAHPPPRGLFLTYEQDQFMQLCRCEIESGNPHWTAGNPCQVRPLV